MYRNRTVSVYFPCRNEAKHLAQIIGAVPDWVDEILVVSNASSDDSVAVARRAGAVALEDNRTVGGIGYGFAHMTALREAKGDIVVGLDADGTYPLDDLSRILDHLLDTNAGFVSCARLRRSQIPFKLRFGVQLLNFEARLLYGLRVSDVLSGMWAMTAAARDSLRLDQGDWNMSPQIKIEAATNPAVNFAEVQIMQKARFGQSHQRYFHTGFSHAWWLLRNRLTHPRPWLLPQERQLAANVESALAPQSPPAVQ